MKKIFGHADRNNISLRSLMFVTGATLLLFAPAFAQGPDGPEGRPGQNLVNGKVQEVNSAEKSLVVNTRGDIQSITVNTDTKILKQTTGSLSDIKVGDTIRISGSLSGTGSKTLLIGDISDLLPPFGAGPGFGMRPFGGPEGGRPPFGGPQDDMQGPPMGGGPQGEFGGPDGGRGPRPPMMGEDGQQPPFGGPDEGPQGGFGGRSHGRRQGPPMMGEGGGPQGRFGGPDGEMGGMPPMGGPEGGRMMPPPPGGGPQGLKGTVTSVKPLTIEINDDVTLVIKTGKTTKVVKLTPIALSAIKAGDRIIAKGETDENGEFVAKTIGVNITPPRPRGPEGFGGNNNHRQGHRQHTQNVPE